MKYRTPMLAEVSADLSALLGDRTIQEPAQHALWIIRSSRMMTLVKAGDYTG